MKETAADRELEAEVGELRQRIARLREAIEAKFLGHEGAVDLLLESLLADGHVLLEGVPGLGKTTLVKELARALYLRFQRIQFTPDLMPADILGTRILEDTPEGGHAFRFEPGPIFTNVLLADEINRATPRTQSALLEAMQERHITLFGETRALEEPFFVIATQNPIEMEGTYPLPEAEIDRFLCKVELRPPGEDDLVAVLDATTGARTPPTEPILQAAEVLRMRELVRAVAASSDIVRLVARIVLATDPANASAPDGVKRFVRYGASPRGGQSLLLLGKARALLEGRPWVSPDDIEARAVPALRHRLVLGYEGEASGIDPAELVTEAVRAATRG